MFLHPNRLFFHWHQSYPPPTSKGRAVRIGLDCSSSRCLNPIQLSLLASLPMNCRPVPCLSPKLGTNKHREPWGDWFGREASNGHGRFVPNGACLSIQANMPAIWKGDDEADRWNQPPACCLRWCSGRNGQARILSVLEPSTGQAKRVISRWD